MTQAYPLARLTTVVALARSRPAPTRLLLRNTDRFGVLHLYFAGGRLLAVEGHRDTPENSLADLATWINGTIRTDEGEVALLGDVDPRLEVALAHALQELAARGVLESPLREHARPSHRHAPSYPAPPSLAPSPRPTARPASFATPRPPSGASRASSPPFASSYPTVQTAVQPSPVGLPPLSAAPEVPLGPPSSVPPRESATSPRMPSVAPAQESPSTPGAPDASPSEDYLSADPTEDYLSAEQWQMLAFAIHQIVAQARVSIGETLTMRVFNQALAHSARSHAACLAPLALDPSGWLTVTPLDAMTAFQVGEVVEAVADVLSGFEMRCASLIGAERAKQIIVAAAAPLRAGLLQIGLDIAG